MSEKPAWLGRHGGKSPYKGFVEDFIPPTPAPKLRTCPEWVLTEMPGREMPTRPPDYKFTKGAAPEVRGLKRTMGGDARLACRGVEAAVRMGGRARGFANYEPEEEVVRFNPVIDSAVRNKLLGRAFPFKGTCKVCRKNNLRLNKMGFCVICDVKISPQIQVGKHVVVLQAGDAKNQGTTGASG